MRMRRFLISALIMALLIPVGLGRLSVMASAEELLGGIVHGNGWELDTATGELLVKSSEFTKNATGLDMGLVKSVTFSNSVQSIAESAFENCSGIESVIIPQTVDVIHKYAFRYCTNLKNLTITEGVKIIGEAAFLGCAKLEKAVIPRSVTSIGDNVFVDCKKLTYLKNRSNVGMEQPVYTGSHQWKYIETDGRSTLLPEERKFNKATILREDLSPWPEFEVVSGKYRYNKTFKELEIFANDIKCPRNYNPRLKAPISDMM